MKFEEIRAFLAVLDAGSFLAGAKALGVPRATLHRRVDALQATVGAPLLNRTSRGIEATAAGTALVEGGRQLVRDAQSLLAAARVADGHLDELSIAVPFGAPRSAQRAALSLFDTHFPDIRLRMHFYPGTVRRDFDTLDAVVHLGLAPPDTSWWTYHLADTMESLVASRDYLAEHGTPTTLEELSGHRLLVLALEGDVDDQLPLLAGGTHPIRPSIKTDNPNVLAVAASDGLGIAMCVRFPSALGDADGLVPVLGDVVGLKREVCVSVRERLTRMPALRDVFRLMKPLLREEFEAPD